MKVDFRHNEKLNHVYGKPQRDEIIDRYFKNVDGEFATGLVDGTRVWLARDWVGSVPFHYIITSDGDIVTANNLRSLMDHPEYDYRHVRAVPGGHLVCIPLDGRFTEKNVREERFAPSLSEEPLIEGSYEELGKAIREKLIEETKKRLDFAGQKKTAIAFSGGIDSFSIVLVLRDLGRLNDIDAYCINTDSKGKDWPNAEKAADYLGLNLKEVRISKQFTIEAVPRTIWLAELYKDYDIFCAVGNYLFGQQLQKDGVEFLLTGDGANEAFRDYTSWGCFQIDKNRMISPEMGVKLLEGRKADDPSRSPQLGTGYAKSSSRGSKVLGYFGIDALNPFLARPVASHIARIDLQKIAEWDDAGNPLWKKRIMQAAFPEVPQELFPLKTRMQDGVGTTDVICSIRRSDLQKNGIKGGFAKYGRGALDDDFQVQNPSYYTDLFRKYFDKLFVEKVNIEEIEKQWKEMLIDLELDTPNGFGWVLAEGSKPK